MSITPGYRAAKKFMMIALQGDVTTLGADYIAGGETPAAILTSGLTVDPLVTDQQSRELDDGLDGGQPVIHTNAQIKITAPIEIAGSGAANTPVAWSPLIQIAGRDEVTSVATEVSHNRVLNASNEVDATIYFYYQGMYHKALGCKATLSREYKTGEQPKCTAEITGIYGGTVKGTPPTPDFSAFSTPEPISHAATSFNMDGQTLNLYEFQLADNNTIEYDEGTEQQRIFITNWAEEGKAIIEAPELDTFDPFAIKLANALVSFGLQHGSTTGKIVKEASSGVQILDVKPAEYKGKQCHELTFRVIRGNDSVLTTK